MKHTSGRVLGKTVWFDAAKGYGFIQGFDAKEYFVHYSSIREAGFKSLSTDTNVEFEPAVDQRGRDIALNVERA